MKIVCISDTHHLHNLLKFEIPDGDILIHAGDFTNVGNKEDVVNFNKWLGKLPHKHKIVIAGNHDWLLYRKKNSRNLLTNCTYLEDEEVTIDGIKFYGSPYTPTFFNWAFMLDRGQPLVDKWKQIPQFTDVLITHGPPYGRLDRTIEGNDTGCEALLGRVLDIKPKYHIFGHIHEAHGMVRNDYTCFINASSCNRAYIPKQEPIVFNI